MHMDTNLAFVDDDMECGGRGEATNSRLRKELSGGWGVITKATSFPGTQTLALGSQDSWLSAQGLWRRALRHLALSGEAQQGTMAQALGNSGARRRAL
jgi:hypothetical protein